MLQFESVVVNCGPLNRFVTRSEWAGRFADAGSALEFRGHGKRAARDEE